MHDGSKNTDNRENNSPERWAGREGLALLTDLYELTMLAGYHHHGMGTEPATFDYFFRSLPAGSGHAIFAGLGPLLDALDELHFRPEDIDYLRSTDNFSSSFLERLAAFELTLDIDAPPEGTLVFPDEPVLRVTGPLLEAQLLETLVLNSLNYPTLIATRASRLSCVAGDDPLMEFGLRRAQGPDGGLSGSRAAYIGGCTATSNVLAGKLYDIPIAGTMAHSWVMAFDDELAAFRAFAESFPGDPVLLVDTYDTLGSGLPNALQVFKELREQGSKKRFSIRLDSGDLARLSKEAFESIREAGFDDPLIVASNQLNEDLIADLKRQQARVNAWGVGTQLITSSEDPSLDGVYKLAAMKREGGGWDPRLKLSSNRSKTTDPGHKRVLRHFNDQGQPIGDILYLHDEELPESDRVTGVPRQELHLKQRIGPFARREELHRPTLRGGKRAVEPESARDVRERALAQRNSLPPEMQRLRNPQSYPVLLSPALAKKKRELLEAFDPGS